MGDRVKVSQPTSKTPVQRTWNKMEPRPFPTQETANVQLETDSAASANLGNYTGMSFYGAPPIQCQEAEETAAEAIPASEEEMPLQRQVEEDEELPEDASVQAKLSVGKQGDKYEQEADNMAAQVMAMPEPTQTVQQQEEGEEETVRQKPLAEAVTPLVQRQTGEAAPGETGASSGLEAQLGATKGGGSPLSDEVRGFMEPRFGTDFSGVRVHTGGDAVQMNRELGAQAFTHGQDIYYGKGKSPGKDDLTAHELTHVVQQSERLFLEKIPSQQPSSIHNIQRESKVSTGTIETSEGIQDIEGEAITPNAYEFQERLLASQQMINNKIDEWAKENFDHVSNSLKTAAESFENWYQSHARSNSPDFVFDVVSAGLSILGLAYPPAGLTAAILGSVLSISESASKYQEKANEEKKIKTAVVVEQAMINKAKKLRGKHSGGGVDNWENLGSVEE